MTTVTPTDRPKSVRNSCVIKVFCGVFMLSRYFLDCSVGVGVFVTGLSQISSFLSFCQTCFLCRVEPYCSTVPREETTSSVIVPSSLCPLRTPVFVSRRRGLLVTSAFPESMNVIMILYCCTTLTVHPFFVLFISHLMGFSGILLQEK